MKKSICIVIPNYITRLIGGAELQSYLLAEELLARGWEVSIISSYLTESDKNNNPQYKNPSIRFLYFKQTQIISVSFFLILRQLLKTDCSVYYVRTDYPHVGAVGLFSWVYRRKMVYACADNECFIKNRYSRQLKKSDYPSLIKRIIRRTDYWFLDRLIEFGKRKAKIIIAQTSEQKNKMLEVFGKQPFLIRNSFKNTDSKIITKEDIVVWVGNLRRIKQPEQFESLFEMLENTGYQFVLIGDKNNEYEQFPGTKNPSFKYLGKLKLEEAEHWIAKSKFIVNTSVSEGFSNTFIQAWFYKTVVASLNADPEALFSIQNLGLFGNGKLELMAEKIKNLMNDDKSRAVITEKAYSIAQSEFDIHSNVTKFETVVLQ